MTPSATSKETPVIRWSWRFSPTPGLSTLSTLQVITQFLEEKLVADARKLEQLGSLERSGCEDDLALGLDLMLAIFVREYDGSSSRRRATGGALYSNHRGIGASQDVEVGPLGRWCIVGSGGIAARLRRWIGARRAAEGIRRVPVEGISSDAGAEFVESLDPGLTQWVLGRVGETRMDRAVRGRHLVVDSVDAHALSQLVIWWH